MSEYIYENMGGIIELQFAETKNIVGFPTSIENVYQSQIQFSEGTGWSDPINVANKADFEDSSNDTDQGNLYSAILNTIIPRYDENNKPITHMSKREIIKITFSNGQSVIMGAPSHPVIPGYIAKTGRYAADLNHVAMSFQHSAPIPCSFYSF